MAGGVLTAAGALGLVAPPALSASCIGPVIGIGTFVDDRSANQAPVPVLRGATIGVVGEWFRDGCNDTGASTGCGVTPRDEESPQTGVELRLIQGDASWTLATADAQEREARYAISWQATVPADARPGSATLEASGASAPVVIG